MKKVFAILKSKKDRNKDYDCILAFSGGRDSSYLLYYLVKVLNLKVLAYSVDNGFIPEQTKLNMKNATNILNVKLVIENHDYLEKCLKHHILAWIHRPTPAMIGVLCTGCRLGMDIRILNFAKKNKIPIVISGGNPFEGGSYKFNIMKITNNKKNYALYYILGYLLQIIRNPRWIMKPTCLITQIKEYYYHYFRAIKMEKKLSILRISPYYSYIRWKENEIISTIKTKLNWKNHPAIESTWRGDCDVSLLKSYLYKKTLGFNDKDDSLSTLIRDNQITREEALERLKKEEISKKVIEETLEKLRLKLRLNYLNFKTLYEMLE